MADNVGYTPGVGATVAADDIAGILHQRVKISLGADGTAVDAPGDGTNGMKVDVTRVTGNVTVVQPTGSSLNAVVTGTVTANAGTGNFTVTQATAGNLNATVAGTVAVSTLPALVAGTAYVGKVQIGDGTNDVGVETVGADAESNTVNAMQAMVREMGYNGTSWDRKRGTVATFKSVQATTAQTGAAVWTPAAGKAVVVTALQIQSFGTTAGTAQVWFGGSADTAYTRGTDAPAFDGEFAPSATNKPGVYVSYATPIRGAADFLLRLTTTNAQSITVTVWGYEI